MDNTQRYRATDALTAILREQGRSRVWLAQKVGVHQSLITHLAAGRRTANARTARQIADIMQAPFFLLWQASADAKSTSADANREDAA